MRMHEKIRLWNRDYWSASLALLAVVQPRNAQCDHVWTHLADNGLLLLVVGCAKCRIRWEFQLISYLKQDRNASTRWLFRNSSTRDAFCLAATYMENSELVNFIGSMGKDVEYTRWECGWLFALPKEAV